MACVKEIGVRLRAWLSPFAQALEPSLTSSLGLLRFALKTSNPEAEPARTDSRKAREPTADGRNTCIHSEILTGRADHRWETCSAPLPGLSREGDSGESEPSMHGLNTFLPHVGPTLSTSRV